MKGFFFVVNLTAKGARFFVKNYEYKRKVRKAVC